MSINASTPLSLEVSKARRVSNERSELQSCVSYYRTISAPPKARIDILVICLNHESVLLSIQRSCLKSSEKVAILYAIMGGVRQHDDSKCVWCRKYVCKIAGCPKVITIEVQLRKMNSVRQCNLELRAKVRFLSLKNHPMCPKTVFHSFSRKILFFPQKFVE